jgi:hypothetical protein
MCATSPSPVICGTSAWPPSCNAEGEERIWEVFMVIQRRTKRDRRLPIRKHQKPVVHAQRKIAPVKWLQTAQMPDYLAEEHPEFCN